MGHAFRGAVTAWLALIALQTIGSSGSGRVASLFADIDALVSRALDPTIPAIPDRRTGASSKPLPSEAPAPAAVVQPASPLLPPVMTGVHPIP